MIELYATVVAQIIAFVVWIARIEMRLRFLEKDHSTCQIARLSAEASTQIKLDEVSRKLAEIATDIKWLTSQKRGEHVQNS